MATRRLPWLLAALLVAVGIGAGAVALCAVDGDRSRRTIFYGGKVFTSVPGSLWAEGVVVQGREIVAVGSSGDVLAYRDAGSVVYNLEGRVLVPGFNDAHVHPVFPTTAYPRAVHVNNPRDFVPGPGPSTPEMLDLVATAAAASANGTWIFGAIGTAILDDPAVDRFVIDARVPDHPVLLFGWTGHGMILNSNALQVLGIGEHDPDPFGGLYERATGTNTINGVVHEYAAWRIFRYFFDRMTDAELIAAYRSAATSAASMGYTSLQEFPVGLEYRRYVRVLDAAGIRIRWRASCFPLGVNEHCNGSARNPLIDPSGIKWIADGTPIERLAALHQEYLDDPDNRGLYNFKPMALSDILERSDSGARRARQVMIHAVGDRAVDTTLTAMEREARDAVWARRRPRFEHGDLVLPHNFDRVRKKGFIVVQNPTHFSLADLIHARWGADLSTHAQPQRSLIEAGIGYAIGSDTPGGTGVPGLDLFLSMVHPVRPSEGISLEDALIAYTAGSARAEFREQVKGMLAPHQLADLAVLSQDITMVPPPALPGTVSTFTMVDGKVVHDSGVLRPQ
jgi:predicted amidohydrolase YtcJ